MSSESKTINGVDVSGEWLPKFLALQVLDIEESTLFVAAKRHTYLSEAIQRGVRHPETGQKYTRIKTEAVLKYLAERKAGGGSSDHPGQFKYTAWLSEEELDKAAKALEKALGRPVELARLYKGKGKDAEAEAETEA